MQDHITTPCVEWGGALSAQGYGRAYLKGRSHVAHRLVYCETHGLNLDDIKGLVIRHKCDNPPCVNPEHLEVGSQSDNMRDKVSRGRGMSKLSDDQVIDIRKRYASGSATYKELAEEYDVWPTTICRILKGISWAHLKKYSYQTRTLKGEGNAKSKLTESQVIEIRERCASGKETQKAIAEEFGLHPRTVGKIYHREKWRHLP